MPSGTDTSVVKLLKPIFISTFLALLLSVVILRDGIRVSPDSWAYWQGSVQLLENGQYRYFFQHQPIRFWPPGYSLYLASWQSWLGVSGKTLVIANITLVTLVAGLWTCLSLVILNSENKFSITNKHLIRHLKICLIIVLAVSIQRVSKQLWDTQFDTSQLNTPSEKFVHTSFTITTSFNDKTPVKKGKLLQITPPFSTGNDCLSDLPP